MTDIEQLADKLGLKKVAGIYLGRCPFHKEHTESFTIIPGLKKYYCYSCSIEGAIEDLKKGNG